MDVLKGTTAFIVHGSMRESVRDFDRAHVWFCDLDALRQLDVSECPVLLPAEAARASRLTNSLERHRFEARCALVRQALGKLVGAAPEALEFYDGISGKPHLVIPSGAEDGHLATLDFNLSHSENILALAVAFGREVGIDVEVVNYGVDALGVAEVSFSKKETEQLRALPPRERTLPFYRLWARKEAMSKATGLGIAASPAPEAQEWSRLTLAHSFQFNFGEKEVVGALALGAEVLVNDAAWPVMNLQPQLSY
jgi:phosphopantetheinyl transferase